MIVEGSNHRPRAARGGAETRGQVVGAAPDKDPFDGYGPVDILSLVTNNAEATRLESGQVLFAEGDAADCMYVVKSGRLRIRSGSVVYEDIGPGGIVGEMGLVERHQPRSATVYALTDAELIAIDDARFVALVGETPRFAVTVMQVLSRRLRAMDRRYRPEPWA